MKKLIPIVLACLMLVLYAAPIYADVIDDPDWPVIVLPEDPPVVPADVETEELPNEEDPPLAAETAETEEAPETEAKKTGRQGFVASEAQSLSAPVIALAAGILAIAMGVLVHSIVRNRREDRFEKEHLHR